MTCIVQKSGLLNKKFDISFQRLNTVLTNVAINCIFYSILFSTMHSITFPSRMNDRGKKCPNNISFLTFSRSMNRIVATITVTCLFTDPDYIIISL